jgi:hypothetical protein
MGNPEVQADATDKLDQLHRGLRSLIERTGPNGVELVQQEHLTELLGQIAEPEPDRPGEVVVDSTPAEDASSAIGWAIMGGLSVALFRSSETEAGGVAQVSEAERSRSGGDDHNEARCWEGVVT